MNVYTIIYLNNCAVHALQRGNLKEAVSLLRIAITDLMQEFGLRAADGESHESFPASEYNESAASIVSASSMETDLDESCSSCSAGEVAEDDDEDDDDEFDKEIVSVPIWSSSSSFNPTQNDDLIFMYTRALALCPCEQNKELLSGVVLYNMALASHARAIQRGRSSLLEVALKFYSLAVTVVRSRKHDLTGSDHWVLLAALVNMTQIHLTRFNSKEFNKCLDITRNLLLILDSTARAMDEEDFAFFCTNATFQIGGFTVAPAA